MTRQEELNEAWCKHMNKCSIEIMQALAFALRWCEEHPHWISVEEELPKEHEWIIGFSLKRHYVDIYNFDSNGLFEAHGITHWMHLSPPPIITSSKKGGEE